MDGPGVVVADDAAGNDTTDGAEDDDAADVADIGVDDAVADNTASAPDADVVVGLTVTMTGGMLTGCGCGCGCGDADSGVDVGVEVDVNADEDATTDEAIWLDEGTRDDGADADDVCGAGVCSVAVRLGTDAGLGRPIDTIGGMCELSGAAPPDVVDIAGTLCRFGLTLPPPCSTC